MAERQTPARSHGPVPRRVLGRTGEQVSAIGVGGWHLGVPAVTEPLAIRIVRRRSTRNQFPRQQLGLQRGVSETRMGKVLAEGYRPRGVPDDEDRRPSEKGSRRQLESRWQKAGRRLHRLVQHHEVSASRIHTESSTKRARKRWLEEARKAGKSGTSASPATRIRTFISTRSNRAQEHGSIFDAVQMPLNVMDAHYRSFGSSSCLSSLPSALASWA